MAKYLGPVDKIARRFKEPIFGPTKALERRKGASSAGKSKGRRKQSEYAVQLTEKQKAKYTYGVLEKQFRITFEKAERRKGVTGEVFLQMLESRLDNVVYRMGFAPSRRAARQVVSHKHVMVNDRVTNISSFQVRPGDVIQIRENSKSLDIISESLGRSRYPWLTVDPVEKRGVFVNYPDRDSIPENLKEQLIVELYSKA